MARLEVTFRVDADGLLHVHAKELTTGIEQTVSVKPTYGLDDATVERMLVDALDHGENDLGKRQLAEACVEARRILRATTKALASDADLLEEGERARIERTCEELVKATEGSSGAVIRSHIEALDNVTKAFAGRRMNRAIALAIEGTRVEVVEERVKHAKGTAEAESERARAVD
jgi:molecular chaperone HscA